MCLKYAIFYPFNAKYSKISSNFLKMSGFSSKNVRYPRYQDTDFLQLCPPLSKFVHFEIKVVRCQRACLLGAELT